MPTVNADNNFSYLTLALVGLLLAAALARTLPGSWAVHLLELMALLTFFVSLKTLYFGLHWQWAFRSLTAALVLLLLFRNSGFLQLPDFPLLLLQLLFYLAVTTAAFRQVLFSPVVTINHVVGSVALYLLIGIIWALLYLLVLQWFPGAIAGIEGTRWNQNFFNAIYYSYVTLTTLGYGDFSPLAPITQILAVLEAVVGVFFMAIVVASLVSGGLMARR